VISNRCQVITSKSQVSSNSMVDNKHSRYHYTGKQYRCEGSVLIQENSTDTEDRYEYKKTILIQGIGMNTEKWYS